MALAKPAGEMEMRKFVGFPHQGKILGFAAIAIGVAEELRLVHGAVIQV